MTLKIVLSSLSSLVTTMLRRYLIYFLLGSFGVACNHTLYFCLKPAPANLGIHIDTFCFSTSNFLTNLDYLILLGLAEYKYTNILYMYTAFLNIFQITHRQSAFQEKIIASNNLSNNVRCTIAIHFKLTSYYENTIFDCFTHLFYLTGQFNQFLTDIISSWHHYHYHVSQTQFKKIYNYALIYKTSSNEN